MGTESLVRICINKYVAVSYMNVFHYIPYMDSDVNSPEHASLDELLRADVFDTVNTVMTNKSSSRYFSSYGLGNRLTTIKSLFWFALFGKKRLKRILQQSGAEIVYIHSVCDFTSMLVAKWASSCRIPVLVSPNKALMPWHTAHYGFLGRILRMSIARCIMVSDTTFVHAVSAQEASVLLNEFSSPFYNVFSKSDSRITPIAPVRKDEEGNEDTNRFSLSFHKLYRRIVDSNPFWLMSGVDRVAENELLVLGISIMSGKEPSETFLPIAHIRNSISELSDEHWRRIQLHSFDQDVYGHIRIARKALSDDADELEVTAVDRISKAVRHVPLENTAAHIRRSRMHHVAEDYERHEKEKQLCVMMLNVKYLYSRNLLTRRHLADLYAAVRYVEYDEYVLESMLDDLDMLKFTGRVIAILSNSMLLSEGYHPVPSIDDRKTKRMKRKLFKSNIE